MADGLSQMRPIVESLAETGRYSPTLGVPSGLGDGGALHAC